MTHPQTLLRKALGKIYRYVEASEKGYATAAANIPAPGLKILFKYFAQRRALFKSEVLAELNRLGGNVRPSVSIAGMIHRGRVNIFAGMTIGTEEQEKVVLQEVVLGEKFALRAYQKILKQDLPAEISKMLNRQLDEIQENSDQVGLLRGKDGMRLAVELLNQADDLKLVIRSVDPAAPSAAFIQEVSLSEAELYRGQGATVRETVLSGAFGGALWGGLMGVLAGFGVVQTSSPAPEGLAALLTLWLSVMLGFMLAGAFISSVLGLFIGLGVSEEGIHELRQEDGLYYVHLRTVEDEDPVRNPVFARRNP